MNALALMAIAPFAFCFVLLFLGFASGGGGVTDLLWASIFFRWAYVWMLLVGAASLLRVYWYRRQVREPLPRSTRVLLKTLFVFAALPVALGIALFIFLQT